MKNDGGPAYPSRRIKLLAPRDVFGEDFKDLPPGVAETIRLLEHETQGMSLRDYFAGQALLGIVSHWQKFCEDHLDDPSLNEPQSRWHQRAAIEAYQYARAMLATREATEQPDQERPGSTDPTAGLSPQSGCEGRTEAVSGQETNNA